MAKQRHTAPPPHGGAVLESAPFTVSLINKFRPQVCSEIREKRGTVAPL